MLLNHTNACLGERLHCTVHLAFPPQTPYIRGHSTRGLGLFGEKS